MPADEIEEQLNLSQINDRAWTIAACSAKDSEGKSNLSHLFLLVCIIGLKEGIDWLTDTLN